MEEDDWRDKTPALHGFAHCLFTRDPAVFFLLFFLFYFFQRSNSPILSYGQQHEKAKTFYLYIYLFLLLFFKLCVRWQRGAIFECRAPEANGATLKNTSARLERFTFIYPLVFSDQFNSYFREPFGCRLPNPCCKPLSTSETVWSFQVINKMLTKPLLINRVD